MATEQQGEVIENDIRTIQQHLVDLEKRRRTLQEETRRAAERASSSKPWTYLVLLFVISGDLWLYYPTIQDLGGRNLSHILLVVLMGIFLLGVVPLFVYFVLAKSLFSTEAAEQKRRQEELDAINRQIEEVRTKTASI